MVKVSTKAINDIVGQDEDVQWTLTDSRRTPAGFLESLKGHSNFNTRTPHDGFRLVA